VVLKAAAGALASLSRTRYPVTPDARQSVRGVGSKLIKLLGGQGTAGLRFKEELVAGINTGIIRAMAGSGSVVTAAGLVFAFTMASFMFSDLIVLGQIGTTIALGLLFDTLIVRSFMTPSIAASVSPPHRYAVSVPRFTALKSTLAVCSVQSTPNFGEPSRQ
jgi:hypothetical protein